MYLSNLCILSSFPPAFAPVGADYRMFVQALRKDGMVLLALSAVLACTGAYQVEIEYKKELYTIKSDESWEFIHFCQLELLLNDWSTEGF